MHNWPAETVLHFTGTPFFSEYVADPAALEYRETQNISPESLVELESELVEMGVGFGDEED